MTTITAKLAKNGVEMYYRVDENGKKHRITAFEGIFAYAKQQREQKAANDAIIDAIDEYIVAAEAQDAAVEAEIDAANNNTEEEPKMTTITTKIAKNGSTRYYVNGKLTRKADIEFKFANNPACEDIIKIDYETAKYQFPNLRNGLGANMVVFTINDTVLMTKAAAKILGFNVRTPFVKGIYHVSPAAANNNTEEEKTMTANNTKAAKIAAIENAIQAVIAERNEAYDELAAAEDNDEIAQWFIDQLKENLEDLGNQYWELVAELDAAKADAARDEIRAEAKADGYKFIVITKSTLIGGNGNRRIVDPTESHHKTYENAIKTLGRYAKFRTNNPAHDGGFELADIDGNIIVKGNSAADFYKFINDEDEPEPTTNNAPETDASEDDDAPEFVEPELGTTGGFPDLYEVTEFTDNGYGKRYTAFDNLRDAFNFANASNFPADITLIQGEQCYFICDNSGKFVTHREKFSRAVHCLIEERDNVSTFDLLPTLDELNDVDDVEPTAAPLTEELRFTPYGNVRQRLFIGDEKIRFFDDEFINLWSGKYRVGVHQLGRNNVHVAVDDEDGGHHWEEFDMDELPEEFWSLMAERGACSFDEPDSPTIDDDDLTPALIVGTKITARDSVILKVDGRRASRATAEDKIYANGDFTVINEFGKVFDGYVTRDGALRILRPEGNSLRFANVNAMVEHLAFDNIFHDDEPVDDTPTTSDAPDTIAAVAETIQDLNEHAPDGWEVFYNADNKNFTVAFDEKPVANLDSLALLKVLPPDEFFSKFQSSADEQFTADRVDEIAALKEMRKQLTGDTERLKIIDDLINDATRAAILG